MVKRPPRESASRMNAKTPVHYAERASAVIEICSSLHSSFKPTHKVKYGRAFSHPQSMRRVDVTCMGAHKIENGRRGRTHTACKDASPAASTKTWVIGRTSGYAAEARAPANNRRVQHRSMRGHIERRRPKLCGSSGRRPILSRHEQTSTSPAKRQRSSSRDITTLQHHNSRMLNEIAEGEACKRVEKEH